MVLDLDLHKLNDPDALQVDWSPIEDELSALRLKRRIHNNSPTLTFNINHTVLIGCSLVIIFFGGTLITFTIGFISLIIQGDFDGISQAWIGFLIICGMSLIFLFMSIRELRRQRTKNLALTSDLVITRREGVVIQSTRYTLCS